MATGAMVDGCHFADLPRQVLPCERTRESLSQPQELFR